MMFFNLSSIFLLAAPLLDISRYRAHASRRACIRSRSSEPAFHPGSLHGIRAPDTEFRRQMLVYLSTFNRLRCHGRHHVSRFHTAAFDLLHIERMDSIDEGAIPLVLGIEIRTEGTVHKNIDDVSKSKE